MNLQRHLGTISTAALLLGAIGCTSDQASTTPPPSTEPPTAKTVKGRASWYGPGFYGRRTTSGEVLRQGTLTAAHSSLPMGTKVKVTRTDTGQSVTVLINDRKPFKPGTVIDLAHGAAVELDLVDDGTSPVQIEVVDQD